MIREPSVPSFSIALTEKINTAAKSNDNCGDNRSTVREIFNSTTCYDVMQASSKAVVFEVTIAFQLAFYAMVENETEVAPLWNPETRTFVGLMTIYDYINALRIYISRGSPMIELASKTIWNMKHSIPFTHPEFHFLEPDKSIYGLCQTLYDSKIDYVPIIDPETGSLVTILGYMDIVHLVDCAAKQYPAIFSDTLETLNIVGRNPNLPIITVKRSMVLADVLTIFENNRINGAPVVDDYGKVINFYHKADVTFIVKATEPDAILVNLKELTIGDILVLREQLMASGEALITTQGLVTCSLTDQINAVLNAMVLYRVTKVVVVDQSFFCIGVVSIKDILAYYLADGVLP